MIGGDRGLVRGMAASFLPLGLPPERGPPASRPPVALRCASTSVFESK